MSGTVPIGLFLLIAWCQELNAPKPGITPVRLTGRKIAQWPWPHGPAPSLLSNRNVSARIVLIALSFLLVTRRLARAADDQEDPRPGPLAQPEEAQLPPVLEEPVRRRTRAVYVMLGFGSPVGGLGLEGVQRFGSQFELAAGFGVGDAAASSEPNPGLGHVLQWAVMPRLRLGGKATALTVGAGISGGEYGAGFLRGFLQFCDQDQCPKSPYPTQYVIWSNLETGFEHWWRNGFAIRAFAGYAHGFAVGDSFNLPYLGVGMGYAF